MLQLTKTFFSLIIIYGLILPTALLSQPPSKNNLEKVTLQLKYKIGFQFAGYYAAQKKRFYAQEGLQVIIKEASTHKNPIDSVLSGKAQYGTWISSILNFRLSGKPLVVLAVIFQHSPFILLSKKEAHLNRPSDLIGKRVVTAEKHLNAQFKAMLIKEGLNPEKIKKVDFIWDVKKLFNNYADAFESYITDGPNRMQMLGIKPAIMRPITYGIDFYGDCLFTSEDEITQHPQRVAAFRRASLKGWEYAMSHVEEMVKIIIKMPGVKERGTTIKHLRYEATQMQKLILPKLVEIGHSNPGRWKHIADTYVSLGMLKKDYSLKGLLYNPNPKKNKNTLYLFLGIFLGVIVVVILALFWTRFLNRLVKQRTQKLNETNKLLNENQERLNLLISNVSSAIIFQLFIKQNGERRFTYISDNVQSIMKISAKEVLANPNCFHSKISPESLPLIIKAENLAIKSMSQFKEEIKLVLPDKRLHWSQVNATPRLLKGGDIIFDGVLIDITELKFAEKEKTILQNQLAHRSKMDALGQLTGGIAHDFNNMLAGIIGAAQLLKSPQRNLDEKGIKYTEMIIQSVTRATELTSKLLSFSRKGKIPFTTVNINSVIDDTLQILNSSIDKKTETVITKNALNPIISGNYSALQNSLINLAINASHAMPLGGKILIETKNIKLNKAYCQASLFELKRGEYLDITIKDSGVGISPENIKKIFDPFFTTKEQGKGTGLGLSTVYGTIQNHRGEITVDSEVNRGTTFHIFLPCSQKNESAAQTNTKISKGTGTILLVDDEEVIRVASKQMLEEMGYTVILANNGLEAVALFKKLHSRVDLVIMDMIMPEMNGQDAFIKMQKIDEHCQVIVASGFTKDKNLAGLKNLGIAGFIQKPFRDYELSQLIHKILSEK